jgi:hypothetical protein
MKNTRFSSSRSVLPTLSACALAIWAGHLPASAQSEPASNALPASLAESTSPTPDGKYLLRWQPQSGELRVFRLKTSQTVTSAGLGQGKLMQSFELDYAMQVLATAPSGAFDVRTTFRAVRFSREAPGVKQRFDSARPGKNPGEEVASYAALAGSSVVLRFDPSGKLLEVRELEKFYERIMDALKVEASSRPFVRNALKASASSREAFRNIGNTIASFPAAPVAVAGTWPKVDVADSEGRMVYDGTSSLQSVQGTLARVAVASKIRLRPDAKAKTAQPGLSVGEQSGWYDVELPSGWTTGASLKQAFSMRIARDGTPTAFDKPGLTLNVSSVFGLRTLGVRAAPQ